MFAIQAGSRGFDSHRRLMSERFFRSCRPGYPHPVCSELEIVVSEWQPVIAVSLNVSGGVCLIKPAKLYKCMQIHHKHDEDRRTARLDISFCAWCFAKFRVYWNLSNLLITRTGIISQMCSKFNYSIVHYSFDSIFVVLKLYQFC